MNFLRRVIRSGLCVFLVLGAAGAGAAETDRLAGELGKAWDILNGGDHERTVVFVNGVMESIGDEALAEARRMIGYAPAGRENDYHRVNVAGTLLYVRALALQRAGKRDDGRAALERVWKEYPFAQAWDPQGWYWKPAQAAKKESFVDRLSTAVTDRSLDASPFPASEDMLDYPQMSIAMATVTSGLLERGEYENLEYLAGRLRDLKLRYPDGGWLITTFYSAASGAAGPDHEDASWERTGERLAAWRDAVPGSVSAQVSEARRLVRHAWRARGSGYASEVKPEVWPIFRERIDRARGVLEACEPKCPAWYVERLVVARAQSDDLVAQRKVFEAGWTAFPGFTPMIDAMVVNLLPRWCGQEGQWQRLAQWLGGRDGPAMYAVAVNDAWAYERAEILAKPGIDRTQYREGWKQLLKERSGSLSFAHLAITIGMSIKDTAITTMGFEAAGDRYHPSYWNTAADFMAARKKVVTPVAKD